MRDSIMLYKHPGPHDIHGDKFDYMVCHQNEMDKYLADGWYLTTTEAKAAFEKGIEECAEEMDNAPVPEEDRFLYTDKLPEPEPKKNKLSYADLSDLEKENIKNDKRAMQTLAKVHNTSYHTIRKIKGRI